MWQPNQYLLELAASCLMYADVRSMFMTFADSFKERVFEVGSGFGLNDTVPLNEHYDAQTGKALGSTHFSWTAAHVLMWSLEEKAKAQN